MNNLAASPRGVKKADAQSESGTDPRVRVLTKKRIKNVSSPVVLY